MVNESLTAKLERYKERVAIFEQRQNVDLNKREKLIDSQMDDLIRNRNAKFAAFQQEIDTLKQTLSNHVKEKESLSTTLTVFKTESKEKESKYIDKEIVLENQNKELENIICKLYRSTQAMHMLTKPQVFYDDTHKQALGYQNPFYLKKAQWIQPTFYDGSVIAKKHDVISLNNIKEDFGKLFVTKKELSAEQAFWLKHSNHTFDTSVKSHTPVRIEAPSELPKVSLVNESLKKLKYHLASFDKMVKNRTTSDAITAVFCRQNDLEIQIKQLSIDNDQLLNQIMSQEIMHIGVSSVDILDVNKSCVNECNKCLELETELLKKKDFIEKDVYDKLDNSGENQNAPIFNQLFEINELKAQSQEKDTVIRKLKDRIKSLSGKDSVENVKKDIDEIETINIELEHSVAKLIFENENLRKERETSVKNSDLNAQVQEKVFAIAALKNELRKLKGVKCSTSASGSKLSGNTTNNRIPQSASSKKINKVEDQSRSVKSKKNKKNRVVKTKCNAHVMQSMLNANSKSVCTICNECLFDVNHDKCVLDYVHDVNGLITSTKIVPTKETTTKSVLTPTQGIIVDSRRPKAPKSVESSSKSKITESRISNSSNFTQSGGSIISNVPSSSLIDCRFENDHIAKIMGYGDYQIGNVTISQVYYVEGLGHNLFSVGQFCDFDLEVAFRKHTCFIRDLEGVDLLKGSRGLVRGLLKLKYQKDHLCSACALGKSKKHSHKPKAEDSIQEKLYLLHMDLCGPMRIQSINGRKYILVIVDDYSRFTWTLKAYYEEVGISHQTSVARSPQQNGIVERKNLATACYTQNRSLIRKRHNKTPYELLRDRKPDLSYLRVFGALCYPTNHDEDLGKLKPKVDIGFFVGYAPAKKAF
ncbi:retrovirus-related pol polyprotein from transposon TNT 1-94 [Tanacetum coccineum]